MTTFSKQGEIDEGKVFMQLKASDRLRLRPHQDAFSFRVERSDLVLWLAQPLPAPAGHLAALQPLPCRLSTQELVDLLKHPFCVDEARRLVLEQLERRYRRRFADHWEFVRFAQQQHLGLDFTTPPRRPQALAPEMRK